MTSSDWGVTAGCHHATVRTAHPSKATVPQTSATGVCGSVSRDPAQGYRKEKEDEEDEEYEEEDEEEEDKEGEDEDKDKEEEEAEEEEESGAA